MTHKPAADAHRNQERALQAAAGRAAGSMAGPAPAPRSILPSPAAVAQAGIFGAALGGMTTGVMELARLKQGEITGEQAMENVVKSCAQSAATMAVASVAAHVVRSHPLFGALALAAAGVGAFTMLSGAGKKPKSKAAKPADGDASEAPPAKKARRTPAKSVNGKAAARKDTTGEAG